MKNNVLCHFAFLFQLEKKQKQKKRKEGARKIFTLLTYITKKNNKRKIVSKK